MDFRVFMRIFGRIFGMIGKRFGRAFRRISRGVNFGVLIRVFRRVFGDAQQTSLGSDDPILRQQIDALDMLINKSDTSSRLIPYLYANI